MLRIPVLCCSREVAMKIRRYMGSNTQEAILKVKMDLGNEAIILSTRKVRQKGLFKIFSKPMVEVLAAIDDNYTEKGDTAKSYGKSAGVSEDGRKYTTYTAEDDKIIRLEDRVNSMENMLQKLYDQLVLGDGKAESASGAGSNNVNRILKLFHGNLIKNEVDADIAKKITNIAVEKIAKGAGVSDVASVLCNIIAGMIGKPSTINLKEDGKPTVVIFLGPTGVGKTTTLAKIAANYSLNYKKNVGLITADTYRIAAVEQLKTYAEILGIPISVIYSPNELKDAIKQYSDMDIVLIDTAGRSFRNKQQFEELSALVNAAEADEVFLVLSATTSYLNCKEIIKHYSFLKDYKLIFTKIDEAPVVGIILNVRMMTGKSLSFITTGQSVPDDIEVVNADKLAKNLLGSIT